MKIIIALLIIITTTSNSYSTECEPNFTGEPFSVNRTSWYSNCDFEDHNIWVYCDTINIPGGTRSTYGMVDNTSGTNKYYKYHVQEYTCNEPPECEAPATWMPASLVPELGDNETLGGYACVPGCDQTSATSLEACDINEHPSPDCFNQSKDTDEMGIDCGGTCFSECDHYCPEDQEYIPLVDDEGTHYGAQVCGFRAEMDQLGNCPNGYEPNFENTGCVKLSFDDFLINPDYEFDPTDITSSSDPGITPSQPDTTDEQATTVDSNAPSTSSETTNNPDGSVTTTEYNGDTPIRTTTTNADGTSTVTNHSTTTSTRTDTNNGKTTTTTTTTTTNQTTYYDSNGNPLGTTTTYNVSSTTGTGDGEGEGGQDGTGDDWAEEVGNYDWTTEELDWTEAEVTDEDIPELEDWNEWYDSKEATNPIKSKLGQYSVQASGQCYVSGSAYGQTIEISFCRFSDVMPIMANILMFCSLISAWYIVVGRQ